MNLLKIFVATLVFAVGFFASLLFFSIIDATRFSCVSRVVTYDGIVFSIMKFPIALHQSGITFYQQSSTGSLKDVSDEKKFPETATIFFVGDIMLGRHVETLTLRNGKNFPFDRIGSYLQEFDTVVGNFEGTIVEDHQRTPDFTFRFSFLSESVEVLVNNNFSIVSLANNHALDFGAEGFVSTKNALAKAKILAPGDPLEASDGSVVHTTVNGVPVTFVSLQFVSSHVTPEDAVALVQSLEDSSEPVIVMVHWGDEYSLQSNRFQQALAHGLIDAGADLIIGHHSHVVQEVELYNDTLIFYSLGNFIFDQYFSQETQEGLGVGVELRADAMNFTLVPIDIIQSQPMMMDDQKKYQWLENLSRRSSPELQEEIKNGNMVY